MPLIQLVVAVCLHADPSVCSEERFSFIESTSITTCMNRAMPYLARWAGDHPEFRIKSWTCSYPGSEQDV